MRALVAQAQAGDRAALDRLCREFRRLVYKVARFYARRDHSNVALDDRAQGGFVGLLRAVQLWDERKRGGAESFTSFCVPWIHAGCQRSEPGLVHVPINARDASGRLPRPAVAWLDAPVRSNSDAPRLDFQPAKGDPAGDIEAAELALLVRAVLASAPMRSRDREILRSRLLDEEQLSDIAERHGLATQRVQQIVSRAMPTILSSLRRALGDRLGYETRRAAARLRRAHKRTHAVCSVPVRQVSGAVLACGKTALAHRMCKAHLARWNRGERGADLERPVGPRGPRPGHARMGKLDAAQVEAIRARLPELDGLNRFGRGALIRALAAKYSVTAETIYRLAAGDSWRNAA